MFLAATMSYTAKEPMCGNIHVKNYLSAETTTSTATTSATPTCITSTLTTPSSPGNSSYKFYGNQSVILLSFTFRQTRIFQTNKPQKIF